MRNISEWAKKEGCWERVRALKFELSADMIKELSSASEVRKIKEEAKKTQKIDNGIKAQERVCNLGANFWSKCLDWTRERKLFTEKDHQIMGVAASIPQKIPTEKQSIHLTGLLDRLADEACPHVARLD